MKRLLPLVCSILLLTGFAINDIKAQSGRESYGQNVIFAELFGPGMSLSFNYDFRFAKTNSGLGMRLGVGGFKFNDVNILSVPVGINYLLGNESKFFEIGLNGIYSSRGFFLLEDSDENNSKIIGMLTLGFRRQLPGKGFNFRVGLNPVFGTDEDGEPYFFPFYGGVSLGYSFWGFEYGGFEVWGFEVWVIQTKYLPITAHRLGGFVVPAEALAKVGGFE